LKIISSLSVLTELQYSSEVPLHPVEVSLGIGNRRYESALIRSETYPSGVDNKTISEEIFEILKIFFKISSDMTPTKYESTRPIIQEEV
jgi:hypothetical protein